MAFTAPALPTTRRSPWLSRGLLGAAAGGAALLAPTLTRTRGAVRRPSDRADLSPADLHFEQVARLRPVEVVSACGLGFDDTFTAEPECYRVLGAPSTGPGSVARGDGRLTLPATPADGPDGVPGALLVAAGGVRAPYAAVEVSVLAFSTDRQRARVHLGLVADAGDHLLAWYDHASGRAGVDLTLGGTTRTLAQADARLADGVRLSFALTATRVAAFADAGDGPRLLVVADLPGPPEGPDLREADVLAGWHHGFGASSAGGATTLSRARGGYAGQLGLRDPHLVTHADGRPVIRDRTAYLTATSAGLGFFETAHWGVWALDLETLALTQVAQLFTRRDSVAGGPDRLFGDHAGHLVLDEERGRWIVATSTWGDFTSQPAEGRTVEVGHCAVPLADDLLSGVHVLRTETLPLPTDDLATPSAGRWDPHVALIDGRWHVAFVNARRFFDFYPALARSAPGADYDELSLLAADPTKAETEGVVLQEIGGRWHLLASDGAANPEHVRRRFCVYDLEMREVGVLDAPYGSNIPWPTVVPVPAGRGRTRWLMVTFDGTPYDEDALGYGTHGDLVVMAAEATRSR